jgi:uncharacterized caspase-like protein
MTCVPLLYAAQERGVGVAQATQQRRVALIIGNSDYAGAPLANPVNDARSMRRELAAMGFEVLYGENLTQNQMKEQVRQFGQKLKSGGVGLFYFAGHGVQVGGRNYLIPIGATVTAEQEVEYEAVDVGRVLAMMESAGNELNIVILDACRNNPFTRSYRSASNGLASVEAPTGSLIAYATAPGAVASDGQGQNGLYTQELLKAMRVPGLTVEEVFKRVRVAVRELSSGKQIPWESSSLTGDFYFVVGGSGTQSPIIMPDPAAFELIYWDSIKGSTDSADFNEYLQKYPNGQFAGIARRRMNSLRAAPDGAAERPGPTGTSSSPATGDEWFTARVRVRGDNTANGWTDSGLMVKRGQLLRITATGEISLTSGGLKSTPSGIEFALIGPQKLMRNEPTGELIAVIGDDNDEFIPIGASREFYAPRDGRLFLGINEGKLEDNTGSYDAVVGIRAVSNLLAAPSASVFPVHVRADGMNNGWTDTGIYLRRGQSVRITATGQISLGRSIKSTPSGTEFALIDPGKLMRSQPTGLLIAVIGADNDDFIAVGSGRTFIASRDGRLFLGVNEGKLDDNIGSYDALVEVEPVKK